MKKHILLFSLPLLFSSCEDVINLDIKEGINQLVVDGWLTNKQEDQIIQLSISQPYFDQSDPIPALNASVIVFEEDSTAHVFIDRDGTGTYFLPKEEANFLKEGRRFALYVKYNDEEFAALSILNRVPKIDSINYEAFSFPISPPDDGPKDGFIASFYGTDPTGAGDTYWVRTAKNGKKLSKPSQISLAYDAGFSPGSQSDGLPFIPPIRQSINDGLYLHGDSLTVELWSITLDAFYYLYQVRQESGNGGIFSTPSANIPTNVFNLDEKSPKKALGFFGISNVSRLSAIIDSTKALPAR